MRFFSISLGVCRTVSVVVILLLLTVFYYHRSIPTSALTISTEFRKVIHDWYDRPHELNDTPSTDLSNATVHDVARITLDAILGKAHEVSKLECPRLDENYYRSLKPTSTLTDESPIEYYFAINLHQCVYVLPSLLGSVLEAMRFLGPQRCALSIVEGRSDDGTVETLELFKTEVEKIGAKYFFSKNDVNPLEVDGQRIILLAQLRNEAMKPMTENPSAFSPDASVVFLNDVSLCTEDILELVHQRRIQEADMVCAMDWTYLGERPTFYDVWIARGMTGDSFFNIPEDGSWENSWDLLWNDDMSRRALHRGKPFQTFACWNGATVFTAKPFLSSQIKFRSPYEGECFQGEPQIFCKEMWYYNYRKIAVVPTVNLEYKDEASRKIKAEKGYVSTWREHQREQDRDYRIEWNNNPPEKTKCMAGFEHQFWVPWDELLADHVGALH